MTTKTKVARRKLSLLELAADLGNVSKACRIMGYSRQQFYEIRRNFETYGADGLLDKPHRGPLHRRSGSRRHVLRRRPQGCRQGLSAERHRLRLALRLGPALHQQDAAHRRPFAQQRCATDLRGARQGGEHGAERQRPRVLRPARQASLRAVPAARGHRAPQDPGQAAAVQRHRRAPAPSSMPTSSPTTQSVRTRAAA